MSDEVDDYYHEAWSKCPFCGRYNGEYGRPLEQHSPRCCYKGDANSRDVIVPNYSKYIDQDDEIFLPMMRALRDLPVVKRKNQELIKHLNGVYYLWAFLEFLARFKK